MQQPINPNHYVAIMAGGVGSRFWPGSREARPKQFLDILGTGKSLLRMTFERFLPLIAVENIYIVTNEMYRELVKIHLPELKDEQILGEPSRNNTAPCLAYTAFKLAMLNPKANLVVAPSDHAIKDEPEFLRRIAQALHFSDTHSALVTLGIEPTEPNTGYGYIRFEQAKTDAPDVFKVANFTEKPNREVAEQMLASGDYLWNAGIFIFKANDLLDAFEQYAKDIFDIFNEGKNAFNTPDERAFLDEYYPKTRNTSIDYAIMEKANNVYTIPSEFGWSDLGTWASLHTELDSDENQNVIHGDNVKTHDVTNTLIRVPKDKLVILRGLDDFIIVDEGDVLLIYPKSEEQEIKKVTEEIKRTLGTAFL
jgi:mannose-1-phosphate guanylyltransferase